jgi:hypothetical protein
MGQTVRSLMAALLARPPAMRRVYNPHSTATYHIGVYGIHQSTKGSLGDIHMWGFCPSSYVHSYRN